jgi:hypothetical protein
MITNPKYKPGDFTFIIDPYTRFTLDFDYKAIDLIGESAWDLLRTNDYDNSFQQGRRSSFDEQRKSNSPDKLRISY